MVACVGLFGAAALAALAAWLALRTRFDGAAAWSGTLAGAGVARVRRVRWPDTYDGVADALAAREPVVFVGSPAAGWNATLRWSPEYLAGAAPVLRTVQYSETGASTWTYSNEAPWSGVAGADGAVSASMAPSGAPSAFRAVDEMRTADFFRICADRSGGPTVYYAGDLGGSAALLDVGPPSDLHLPRWAARVAGGGEPDDVVNFAWFGCRGVSAHAHRDAQYNLYLQIAGRKRFLVFPPSSGPLLWPYPRMHPSRGQSAVDWEAPDARAHPEFLARESQDALRAEAAVAELRPGDLLYLPPHFWHRVTTEEDSISISMWLRDEAARAFDRLVRVSVPVRASWSPPARRAAAGLFLRVVLAACPRARGEDALAHLLRVRYRAASGVPHAAMPRAGGPGGPLLESCAPPDGADRVAAEARRAAGIVRGMAGHDAGAAVEFALDYAEEIAAAAVGPQMVLRLFGELAAQRCEDARHLT